MCESPTTAPPAAPSTGAALVAEAFGTLLLVSATIGTALFASGFGAGTDASNKGVGFLGIALAVGLAVVVGTYAFGPLSGGHFNPAVTLGLAAAGRFPWKGVAAYIAAQVVGGLVATTLLVLVSLSCPNDFLTKAVTAGFASNGWGTLSPAGFGIGGAIIVETLFTLLFLAVFLGVTHPIRGTRFAGLAIGLTLTLIHLATIPIDFTSVNPARSIATAVYGGTTALGQLWVFIVFPILGAMVAGFAYKALFDGTKQAAAPPAL
jgi:aquaporin Z